MTVMESGPLAAAKEAASKVVDLTINDDGHSEIKPGMISETKNLYPSKPDRNGRITWVDTYPDHLTDPVENAETARYALLIRNSKCYDGRKKLQIDSIVVQSPLLKRVLGTVLKDYPGITTTLDRLTFSPPFQPFIHRWKSLVEALQADHDPTTRAHLNLLHRILEAELRDDLKARDDYILNGVITHSTIWMIFEPGTIVFATKDGQPCAAKFNNGAYQNNRCCSYYNLYCQDVDWDGEKFGLGDTRFTIWEFGGTAKITKLAAFPLEYHPNLNKMKDQLIARGKVFESLSGYSYKNYQGIAVGDGPWGSVKYKVDSRIILDTYAWNRFNPNKQVHLATLTKSNRTLTKPNRKAAVVEDSDDYDEYDEDDDDDDDENDDDDEGDYETSCYSEEDSIEYEGQFEGEKNAPAPLTDDQLLLCGAFLKGYSLRDKKWLTFSVGSVKDIKWNEGAFDNLVLPEDHKELILALTESQVAHKDTFDDVIQGKGKGMIMLLSGPPGVGKTLTAESVAESMKAPLYMMSAGDLGLSSSGVESSLSNVLEMATKWNAILLLDEADVFLEQRSAHDLERNKLVSIFLRILEYYEGILFLTTNRVDNIDAAFQSRIHISMQYNELSTSSRRHVWNNFLTASSKSKKHGLSDEDLDKLADYMMNGREIKNVLKTAQLLARKKGSELGYEHVKSVLAIEKRHIIDGKA